MKSRILSSYLILSLASSLALAGVGEEKLPAPVVANPVTDTSAQGPGSAAPEAGSGAATGGESAAVPSAAVPADPVAESRAMHRKKAEADAMAMAAKNSRENLFANRDKKPINDLLDRIMGMIESKRGGTAKLRTVAYDLTRLIQIHKEMEIGSKEKAQALAELSRDVDQDLATVKGQPRYPMGSNEAIGAAISALSQDKIDPLVINLLNDYYLGHMGYLKVDGVRCGAACIIGAEVGMAVGTSATATGRRYGVVRPSVHATVGVGAFFALTHTEGPANLDAPLRHVVTERMGLPCDAFLASKSNAIELFPGDPLKTEDKVLSLGIRAGSTGLSTELKVCPLWGRNFKFLREKLGLIP